MAKKTVKAKQHAKPDLPTDEIPNVPDPAEGPEGDMSDAEAEAMVSRAANRKEETIREEEDEVDQQQWTRNDPVIPEDLLKRGSVWIAVYKCPHGHKTKATNRQAGSGIKCWQCLQDKKNEKATIMDQFRTKPTQPDRDQERVDKRNKARKGSE